MGYLEATNEIIDYYNNHCKQRAIERYNFNITQEDIDYILEQCLMGNAKKLLVRNKFGILQDSPDKAGAYRLSYKNKLLVVAVKKFKHGKYTLATFLPPDNNLEQNYIDGKVSKELRKHGSKL